jgi:phosphatidylserine/phosphatidylglycerophosphate/cardiolipin synthase-like enzyme
MLLQPGTTCWRVERAQRLGLFIDMEAYFVAAREAMKAARHSIHALNWAFDPATLFEPDENGDGPDSDRFGPFLRDLACAKPQLDVRILCWRSALPVAASQNFFPHRARKCFHNTPVKFRLDGSIPFGACHHQKMIVIDDRIAFCGGGDIGPDRWDTIHHLDDDPRRQIKPRKGKDFESRHELMGLVDGEAAAALGQLFRDRWERATRESLSDIEALEPMERAAKGDTPSNDPWPDCVPVAAREVTVGIARTMPKWRSYPEVRENERLHLAAIKSAKRLIYMENQYFTAPVMAKALAERLAEPDGPEVVLISTLHSPSYFDQATMDKTRLRFLKVLKDADQGGRMHCFCPVTKKGRFIIVHAKLTIIDDELLRIGSANLNNRSTGFDTECDLVIEASGGADDDATRAAIAKYRAQLMAHWLHTPVETFEAELAKGQGLGAAIKALDDPNHRLLRPLEPKPIGPLASLIARFHLGDPNGVADSWRPWRREAAMERDAEL